jgi:hypothetical protein
VSIAQLYAVDQPAGRVIVGAEGDAEDALVGVDGEPAWSEDEVEENPVAVDELVVAVDELAVMVDVKLVLVLVLVVTEVDVVLLSVEVLVLNATLDDEECVVDVVLGWLLELLVAQLESAVLGHRPTLGMRTAPMLYHIGSQHRGCAKSSPSTLTVEYVHSPAKYVQWSSPNSAKSVTSGPPRASCPGHAYEQDRSAGAARVALRSPRHD